MFPAGFEIVSRDLMCHKSIVMPTKSREPSAIENGTAPVADIPVKSNVGIILSQLVAIAACCYASAGVESGWSLAILALVFGIVMNSVYSIIHEAEHAMLFPNRRWNDLVGAFMALFFPAPFHLIRQGHLGHHFRNRSDDEAFDLYFEGDHRLWRCLIFYGILTGCYWVVVVLGNVVFLFFPFAVNKQ
jgi:fatty acid desaturase